MPTKRTRLVEAVTGGGKHGNLRLSSNKTIKNSSGERVKVSHKSDKQLQSSLSTTSEPHESGDTVANTETHLADDESVISSPPSNTSCGAETPKFSNEQGMVFITFCKTSCIIGNCNHVIDKAVKSLGITMTM
jgi:hypothetical protein